MLDLVKKVFSARLVCLLFIQTFFSLIRTWLQVDLLRYVVKYKKWFFKCYGWCLILKVQITMCSYSNLRMNASRMMVLQRLPQMMRFASWMHFSNKSCATVLIWKCIDILCVQIFSNAFTGVCIFVLCSFKLSSLSSELGHKWIYWGM